MVKNYPWVSIHTRGAFAAQLARVRKLLAGRAKPGRIFLNDLQGGPSACGCGNTLCRWTTDYGPVRTAERLPADAAARFVKAVEKTVPDARVIPVWTTECEEKDGAKDGACAGVGCFRGACWKEYTAQLESLEKTSRRIGVLLPYQDFRRDLPRYGPEAGWVRQALGSFQSMPAKHRRRPVDGARLVAVLQGWDVSADDVRAQIARAREAGAGSYVVARTRIDQRWQPKVISVKR